MNALGTVRRRLFGIPSTRAVFNRPGFVKEAWTNFSPVAIALVEGYHASLEDSRFSVLIPRLEAVEPEYRGFAYEGAGMGLAALDIMAPWKNRVKDFVEGPAAPAPHHMYPIYVGVGLALARLHRSPEKFFPRLDPLLCWVVVDGYGFHEGFFAWKRTVERKVVPAHFSPYAVRLFDQGLGRCLWFASGALVDRVAALISTFPQERQVDLWSGVGLASSFAGGSNRGELEMLRETAAPYRLQLARGAAVAAKGHQDARHSSPHTELACQVYSGLSGAQAAQILDEARQNLPMHDKEPAYEIWRKRTQEQFALELGRRK
jgi:enediyne biosynthesis protein E3